MNYSRTRIRPLVKKGTMSGGISGAIPYEASFEWSWSVKGSTKKFLGTTITIPPGKHADGSPILDAPTDQVVEAQLWKAYLAYFTPRAKKEAQAIFKVMVPSYTVWSEESFSDAPTPSFKKLSAAGEVIITDCYKTSHIFRQDPVSLPLEVTPPTVPRFSGVIDATGGNLVLSQEFGYVFFYAEAPKEAAEFLWSQATPTLNVDMSTVSDAYGNMQAFDFQNLVDLGEFRETMSTFEKSARSVANIYRQLRKGNFKRYAKRTAKKFANQDFENKAQAISDAWLEARFAWRPLVLNVQSAVKRVLETRERTPRRTFRAKHNQVKTSSFSYSITSNGVLYEYVGTRTESNINRAGILAAVNTNMGHSELQAELGLYDFAGTLWELAPYSFVVDWFININGLLYSICPSPVFKPLGSWLTTTSSVEIAGTVKCTVAGRSKTGTFSVSHQIKQRLASPNAPAIAWNPNLNFGKLLDAVSLLKRFVIFR